MHFSKDKIWLSGESCSVRSVLSEEIRLQLYGMGQSMCKIMSSCSILRSMLGGRLDVGAVAEENSVRQRIGGE